MNGKRALICGAGIAGPALAYWLQRWGYEVTVAEIAPAPRKGGYVIDFWGKGFDVAERMGIVPELRKHDLRIEEMVLVDERGRRQAAFQVRALRKIVRDRYMSLARSKLAEVLYECVSGVVSFRFGETVERIKQDESGVDVAFRSGVKQRFEVVIGADGLHSTVRRIVFGDEERFTHFFGFYVAAFTVEGYPHKAAHAYVSYATPDRQAARFTMPGGETGVLLVFRREAHGEERLGREKQMALVREVFQDQGWECAELVESMERARDFYFDVVSQVRMPAWSNGRVGLLGDAGFCPSLLSGQGSALAMVGAYVLAGELHAAGGDVELGLRRYEERMRGFVEGKQKLAERFAGSFVPRTWRGIWFRKIVTRMTRVPTVARWVFGRYLEDRLEMPEYE